MSSVWMALTLLAFLPGPLAAVRVEGSAAPVSADTLRLVVASAGNEVRYRVNEQLVGVELPNDAVGRTSAIEGQVVVDGEGRIDQDRSRFVIDLTTLTSDIGMRDRYLQRRTLETETYPEAVFVPARFQGLSFPLRDGPLEFELVGELTMHGVAHHVTWSVTGERRAGELRGTARMRTTFGVWNLTIPRVMRVLSIKDEIRLEYDFNLTAQPTGGV